jgi:exonuclease VII large subunit
MRHKWILITLSSIRMFSITAVLKRRIKIHAYEGNISRERRQFLKCSKHERTVTPQKLVCKRHSGRILRMDGGQTNTNRLPNMSTLTVCSECKENKKTIQVILTVNYKVLRKGYGLQNESKEKVIIRTANLRDGESLFMRFLQYTRLQ